MAAVFSSVPMHPGQCAPVSQALCAQASTASSSGSQYSGSSQPILGLGLKLVAGLKSVALLRTGLKVWVSAAALYDVVSFSFLERFGISRGVG
ncbi:hypothetical protein U1Q18_011931 [Sarracenia purpurea var. burkii]